MEIPKELEGKPVWTIYTARTTPPSSIVMRSPALREFEGRKFLVGLVENPGKTDTWSEGKTVAVAWDSVTSILAMDDEEVAGVLAQTRSSADSKQGRKKATGLWAWLGGAGSK